MMCTFNTTQPQSASGVAEKPTFIRNHVSCTFLLFACKYPDARKKFFHAPLPSLRAAPVHIYPAHIWKGVPVLVMFKKKREILGRISLCLANKATACVENAGLIPSRIIRDTCRQKG